MVSLQLHATAPQSLLWLLTPYTLARVGEASTMQGHHLWKFSAIQTQHKAIVDKIYPQNASTKYISSPSKSTFPVLLNNANIYCISYIRNLVGLLPFLIPHG